MGGHCGLVLGVLDFGPTGRRFLSALCQRTDFLPVVHDWVIKGVGMFRRVCVSGHIKDPVPPIDMSRVSCPGGRFSPSIIHQVIIITGLNKLYDCMLSP